MNLPHGLAEPRQRGGALSFCFRRFVLPQASGLTPAVNGFAGSEGRKAVPSSRFQVPSSKANGRVVRGGRGNPYRVPRILRILVPRIPNSPGNLEIPSFIQEAALPRRAQENLLGHFSPCLTRQDLGQRRLGPRLA